MLEDNSGTPQMSLDHLIPRINGGSNEATNLFSAHHRCNSNRGDRDIVEYLDAQMVAGNGWKWNAPQRVKRMIKNQCRKSLIRPLRIAKSIIKDFGFGPP